MRTSMPMACGITRMSLKIMAASSRPEYLLIGWSVTSHASDGVRQISKNSCFARTARNSVDTNVSTMPAQCLSDKECYYIPGRYRPAWRITQTGARSVSSPGERYEISKVKTKRVLKRGTPCCAEDKIVFKYGKLFAEGYFYHGGGWRTTVGRPRICQAVAAALNTMTRQNM